MRKKCSRRKHGSGLRLAGSGKKLDALRKWAKKLNSHAKKNKTLSKGFRRLANSQGLKQASVAGSVMRALGYGKHGSGLKLAGQGLRLAGSGSGKRKCVKHCRRRKK